VAVARVILGEAPDQLPPMSASEAATETVFLVAREQSKHWKSVDPKACEPREGIFNSDSRFSLVFITPYRPGGS
jgi:histone deacetylase 6